MAKSSVLQCCLAISIIAMVKICSWFVGFLLLVLVYMFSERLFTSFKHFNKLYNIFFLANKCCMGAIDFGVKLPIGVKRLFIGVNRKKNIFATISFLQLCSIMFKLFVCSNWTIMFKILSLVTVSILIVINLYIYIYIYRHLLNLWILEIIIIAKNYVNLLITIWVIEIFNMQDRKPSSWTDDLPVCYLSGVGSSTNQIYREDGIRQEAHEFEDRSFHFRFQENSSVKINVILL